MNTPRTLWAVVPVKPFGQAKKRLSGILTANERAQLAEAMFRDVLSALERAPSIAGILVVTRDPDAAAIARRAGAVILQEKSNAGISAAVEDAARHLSMAKCGGMLVVPADLPLITPVDIEMIAAAHHESPSVTMVAASKDGGTNALACSPPDVMPFCYGKDSFKGHLATARSLAIEPKLLTLPRFGLDIDRPADVLAFLATPSETRSFTLLSSKGIAHRILSQDRSRDNPTIALVPSHFEKEDDDHE